MSEMEQCFKACPGCPALDLLRNEYGLSQDLQALEWEDHATYTELDIANDDSARVAESIQFDAAFGVESAQKDLEWLDATKQRLGIDDEAHTVAASQRLAASQARIDDYDQAMSALTAQAQEITKRCESRKPATVNVLGRYVTRCASQKRFVRGRYDFMVPVRFFFNR